MDKFSFRIDSENRGYVEINGEELHDVTKMCIHGTPNDFTVYVEQMKRNSYGNIEFDENNNLVIFGTMRQFKGEWME